MSVPQPNILSDLRKELFIYRVFILFPFGILQNHQLVTTWRVKLYMYSVFLAYVTLRLTFLLEYYNSFFQFVQINGKIWMLITTFDLVFSALSFVGIFMNGLIMNIQQIEFYQELLKFDIMVKDIFGILVKRSRTRRINSSVMIASLAYNICLFCFHLSLNSGITILNSFQQFAYFFTYCFFNVITITSAHMFINCAQLCRERLEIVRKLLQNQNRCSTIAIVMQLYTQICKQILLINSFMGLVVLLKVIRDFTLGSSIMYLMCTSLDKREISEIAYILIMFSQAVIGTLLMVIIADKLMTEVTIYILNIMQLLDS